MSFCTPTSRRVPRKRTLLLPILLILLLTLGGCAPSGSMIYSREHQSTTEEPRPDAISSCDELFSALRAMVRTGAESDTLLIADYDGDLDADLEALTARLHDEDAFGAFAVSTLVCKQVSILSKTQLTVSIQYKRTPQDIARVTQVLSREDLEQRISAQLTRFGSGGIYFLDGIPLDDPDELIERYWLQHPDAAVGLKEYSAAFYPETGTERILEIGLTYLDTPAALLQAGSDIRRAAQAICADFTGESDADKAAFIYDYLREHVEYDTDAMRVVAETNARQAKTPLYTADGALLDGRAAQSGIALAAKALCDALELPADVLSGTRDGMPYVWLYVTLDGTAWHFDPTAPADIPAADTADEADDPASGEVSYLISPSDARQIFVWNKRLYGVY